MMRASLPFRMGYRHAKTHGVAVILYVTRVARKPQRFGEVIHDLGKMIERMREFSRVRPVAVSKDRVIGRDKGEDRLEYP